MPRLHLRLLFTALLGVVLASASGCRSSATEESAVLRGDQAFAEGKYEAALAEYRLAVRQGADDAATLSRVAHTYAMMGRVDQVGSFYDQAVAEDSTVSDLAVADLMHLARESLEDGDTFAMASAVEDALKLRPGLGVGDLALPLARHYYKNGQYGKALPFYLKVMGNRLDDADPQIVFEVGRVYDQIGDCQHAMVFFEKFRGMVRPNRRGEVDWYIGSCAFKLSGELRSRSTVTPEDLDQALQLVNRTLEVGEPRNIQAQAWFEKGEILSDLGQCEAAMNAYRQVRFSDASGALSDRAQDRFDEIRFGRGLDSLRTGACR